MRSFIGILCSFLFISCEDKTVSESSQNARQEVISEPVEVDTTKALRDSLAQINDEYFSYDEEFPVNTTVNFKEFSIEILSYQVQNELKDLTTVSGDTIELSEWVGSNLMNRKINIKSNDKTLSFDVSCCFNDVINEQYNPKTAADEIGWEEWKEKRNRWEGFTAYQNIKIKDKSFIFPNLDFEKYCLKLRKKQLRLRDTFVDLSTEADYIANVVYKEKASIHEVEHVIIRITATDSKQQKCVKYLKIYLSKGC